MKRKSSLMLIELTVMLLVLAASAALCLRGFAWSDEKTREINRRDQALVQLQNAAEVLQAYDGNFAAAAAAFGGTWDNDRWVIPMEDGTVLYAEPEATETTGLGASRLVAVYEAQQLFALRVCWQEVGNEK